PPCRATPPWRRTYTSVTVTQSRQHGSTPKPPDQRPTSQNATTSRDRPHGSTWNCAAERAGGRRQTFTDPIGTVCSPCWLGGPRHLTVTSPKTPCSWPLPGDHRKPNPLRQLRRSEP